MMVRALIHELPIPAPSILSRFVAQNPHSHWLDSANPQHPRSRYSVLALPFAILEWQELQRATLRPIAREGFDFEFQDCRLFDEASAWEFLEKFLNSFPQESQLGFGGGLLAAMTYEASAHLFAQRFPAVQKFLRPLSLAFPQIYFALVDTGILIDHRQNQAWAFSWGIENDFSSVSAALAGQRLKQLLDLLEFAACGETQSPLRLARYEEKTSYQKNDFDIEFQKYAPKFQAVVEAIGRGDVYQVNLSQKFSVEGVWNSAALYQKLRRKSLAPQMAFLNWGDHQILCASPETFFEVEGRCIRSFPIKGTRARQSLLAEDLKVQQELRSSAKDQAELLMIVDLIRNDLGAFCEKGSVRVPQLKNLESFSQVHHLVAEVAGKLPEQVSALQAWRQMSPGGSITGAPKSKAIELIARLEDHERGIYTGSIGMIGFNGQAQFNLAIRTALLQKNTLEYCAGGGIVADSKVESEFQEILDKARGFFEICSQGS